jgi:protein TonB
MAAHSDHGSESGTELKTSQEEIVVPAMAKSTAQTHDSQASSGLAEPKSETGKSRAGFGTSAASAPAPARETVAVSSEKRPEAVPSPAESTEKLVKDSAVPSGGMSAIAPTFTFGGNISSGAEAESGGGKKWLLTAVAVVVIVAGGYAAWAHWGRTNDDTSVPARLVESPVKTPAVEKTSPAVQTSPISAAVPASTAPDVPASETAGKAPAHPSKVTAESGSSKPSPSAQVTGKTAAPKEDVEPIIIKNNHTKPAGKSLAINDAPAPPIAGIAPAGNGGGLPNLMDSNSNTPTPILQRLNVSQGVSRGLLVKEVQPKYPANALRLRVEGSVQLLATVSKDGDISAVKILSGDQQLAHAAADAVKQWKYKPYLLNGSPVEIQTQITVNFKLPK